MKQFYLIAVLALAVSTVTYSQSDPSSLVYAEVSALASSTGRTPFWLRANRFGTAPLSAPVGTLRLGLSGSIPLSDTATGRYHARFNRIWTLQYGAEAVGNGGAVTQFLLPEAYIGLRYRRVELVAGRRREVIGLGDSTLSSGSYAWSGNALPLPKIQFGTRGFAPIGQRGWLAINGFFAHGWFSDTWYMRHSFLHQKSLIWRVGKPQWGFRAYVGINHNVQWGGQTDYLDPRFAFNGQLPGRLSDFGNVVFAIRTNGLHNDRITSFDYVNLYGNHLGSLDFAAEFFLPSFTLLLYHQHLFDDVSGIFFQNFPDGLSGLRLRTTGRSKAFFRINDLLLEFLTTLNQSGDTYLQPAGRSKGADNYFNNQQYQEGWSYQDRIVGTPFLTRRQDVRPAYGNNTHWLVGNNRIQMIHLGLRATLAGRIDLRAKMSYSLNYGVPGEPLPGTPRQWSSLVQLGVPLRILGGTYLTAAVAADVGQLYPNTTGGFVGLRKLIRTQPFGQKQAASP